MKGTPYRLIIISFLLACIMSACDSQEIEAQPDSSTMKFSVELKSRADVVNNSNITEKPFVVYSDMIATGITDDTKFIPVHDATEVSFNNSAKEWTYDNTQYWFPGFEYSFVACYPAGNRAVTGISYAKNHLNFTYNQPSDYKSAPDLLISTHRRNYEGGRAEPVRFGFTHILTKINLQVTYNCAATGPANITIDNLTLRNIPTQSIYSIEPAQLTGDSKMTSDWVNDDDSQMGWKVKNRDTIIIKFTGVAPRIVESNRGPFQLFSDNDALLLLPRPDDSDDPAELELTYTTDAGDTETVSAIIPRGWDPGTSLTFSLRIDNGIVKFDINVADWQDGLPTNTTVPRK